MLMLAVNIKRAEKTWEALMASDVGTLILFDPAGQFAPRQRLQQIHSGG